LSDTQFLFIDLVITTTLAVTIGRQGPANRLGVKRPPGSLVAATNLIPIVLQIFTCVAVQIGAMYFLYQQDWFEPVPDRAKGEEVTQCWENTVMFVVSSFQYLILAFVYSKGKPYRQMLIRNFWFLFSALALTCFQVWLLIAPSKEVAEFFQIMYLPHKAREQIYFRDKLLLIPIAHFLAAIFIEVTTMTFLLIDEVMSQYFLRWVLLIGIG
jgi:cation-transporting ATPase 13A2